MKKIDSIALTAERGSANNNNQGPWNSMAPLMG